MEVRSTIITALLALGVSAGFATVHADEHNGFATQKVSYADLNLDSDIGAKVFYSRVQNAAKAVCAGYDSHELMVATHQEGCLDKAVSAAVSQVNNNKVTALYTHSKTTSMKLVASR